MADDVVERLAGLRAGMPTNADLAAAVAQACSEASDGPRGAAQSAERLMRNDEVAAPR